LCSCGGASNGRRLERCSCGSWKEKGDTFFPKPDFKRASVMALPNQRPQKKIEHSPGKEKELPLKKGKNGPPGARNEKKRWWKKEVSAGKKKTKPKGSPTSPPCLRGNHRTNCCCLEKRGEKKRRSRALTGGEKSEPSKGKTKNFYRTVRFRKKRRGKPRKKKGYEDRREKTYGLEKGDRSFTGHPGVEQGPGGERRKKPPCGGRNDDELSILGGARKRVKPRGKIVSGKLSESSSTRKGRPRGQRRKKKGCRGKWFPREKRRAIKSQKRRQKKKVVGDAGRGNFLKKKGLRPRGAQHQLGKSWSKSFRTLTGSAPGEGGFCLRKSLVKFKSQGKKGLLSGVQQPRRGGEKRTSQKGVLFRQKRLSRGEERTKPEQKGGNMNTQ